MRVNNFRVRDTRLAFFLTFRKVTAFFRSRAILPSSEARIFIIPRHRESVSSSFFFFFFQRAINDAGRRARFYKGDRIMRPIALAGCPFLTPELCNSP